MILREENYNIEYNGKRYKYSSRVANTSTPVLIVREDTTILDITDNVTNTPPQLIIGA